MMKNALSSGGTGLFGRHMVPFLRQEGIDVTVTGVSADGTGDDGVVRLDVTDPASVDSIMNSVRPDVVFNFGIQNSVSRAWKDPGETVDTNVTGGINILDAARRLDVMPVVIMAGSGEEYGPHSFDAFPLKEDMQPHPDNVFAATMACSAQMCRIYAGAYGMRIIVARTFNETGPGQSSRFVIDDFCSQFAGAAASGLSEFPLYVGNINVERDFTDVRDIVRALFLLAEKGRAGEIYNVGRGHAVPVRRIIEILEELTGVTAIIHADALRFRPQDAPKYEADTGKLFADTGWKPEIPLEKTVSDIYRYWEKERRQ